MTNPKYGYAHRKMRAKVKRIVDAGQAWCCLCGEWIAPDAAWDLDHVPGTTSEYRGAACASCNRRDGVHRRDQQRPPTSVTWDL